MMHDVKLLRHRASLVGVALGCLVIAGCGGSDTTEAGSEPTTTPAPNLQAAASVTPPQPATSPPEVESEPTATPTVTAEAIPESPHTELTQLGMAGGQPALAQPVCDAIPLASVEEAVGSTITDASPRVVTQPVLIPSEVEATTEYRCHYAYGAEESLWISVIPDLDFDLVFDSWAHGLPEVEVEGPAVADESRYLEAEFGTGPLLYSFARVDTATVMVVGTVPTPMAGMLLELLADAVENGNVTAQAPDPTLTSDPSDASSISERSDFVGQLATDVAASDSMGIAEPLAQPLCDLLNEDIVRGAAGNAELGGGFPEAFRAQKLDIWCEFRFLDGQRVIIGVAPDAKLADVVDAFGPGGAAEEIEGQPAAADSASLRYDGDQGDRFVAVRQVGPDVAYADAPESMERADPLADELAKAID